MSSQKENTRTCTMCGSSSSKDPSITLHRFPKPGSKNVVRCELWAKYCFPNEAWSSAKFQAELHSKHKMLCSKHFESTCFIEKNLFRTAVPGVQSNKMSCNDYRKCAKCGRTRAEDPSVTYHRFPNPGTSNLIKARAWAEYCWPQGDWTHASLLSLHMKNRVLCGRHFSASQFYDNKRQKLIKFAIPDSHEVINLLSDRENVFNQNVQNLDDEPSVMLLVSKDKASPICTKQMLLLDTESNNSQPSTSGVISELHNMSDESSEDNFNTNDETRGSIEMLESNPLELNETNNDTSMETDKTFIQTPFCLEINENDYSKQLENQGDAPLESETKKLPLLKVKVFDTQEVNLLNKEQTPHLSKRSKKTDLIPVSKLIRVNHNTLNKKPFIENKLVLPKFQECCVNVKKLPKVITDSVNNENHDTRQKVTTVEAPNKIYKVVKINNKIMLVEQNENDLDLESDADDSSLDEDYDPNKDANISDADSDICDELQKPEKVTPKQVIQNEKEIPVKQAPNKQKQGNDTYTESETVDKSQFISKKPFPSYFKSDNPFMSKKSHIPNVLNNTKAYKNIYPGVYVARDQINNNQYSDANELSEKEKPSKFTRVVEDFVNQFSDIMNYEWYNEQDILIYGKKGTAMVLLHEAKYKSMKKVVEETKLIEEAFEKHVAEQSQLQVKYHNVQWELIKAQKDLDKVTEEHKKVKNELNELNEKRYLPLKTLFKEVLKELIALRALRDNLSKNFSHAQMSLLTKKKDKEPWSEEDIKKIMFLKSNISPVAYKFLKSQMKFPLPTFKLVEEWMAQRNLPLCRTKRKHKKGKNSLDVDKVNVSKEDTTMSLQLNETPQQDETQSAIEMIMEQPQVEVAHTEQQEICLSYVDDSNNVNEEYCIIDESYVNNDESYVNNDGSYVADEMYVQDGDDIQHNNVTDDSQIVVMQDDVDYANNESYVEHINDGNDENVDYIDAQNQTEHDNTVTDNIVDNELTNNEEDELQNKNNVTNEEIELIRPGKFAKWDLNTLQNFTQRRTKLNHRYNWNRTCQLCMRQFESADELTQHVPLHYNNIYVTPYINAQRPYKCDFCQEQLPHRFALVKHHVEHLNITEFRCWQPGCTYVGKRKESLLAHAEKHLPRDHECPSCAARFKDRPALREHYARKHSVRGRYTCTLCGGKFYSEFTYYVHMKSHNKPPRFKCNVDGCTEAFYCQRARTAHRQTHTGRTVYQCPHCPIAMFLTRNMFNKHMQRHNSDKMSKCSRCFKIFDTYTEYYYHIKTEPHEPRTNTHTCFCKQIFRFKKELKNHQKQCELAAKPWRDLNLGKLEQAMMLACSYNSKEDNKYDGNDQISSLLTQVRNSKNTPEKVVQKKPLKLFPVSEEQQKMLEKMTRLKKLIPVTSGEKIERFNVSQKVDSGKIKNLLKTNDENNANTPLQQINVSGDQESNEIISQQKVIVDDSYMEENDQSSVTASEITFEEVVPVTHEVTPVTHKVSTVTHEASFGVIAAKPIHKPKVTLSKNLRKISVYEFQKFMAKIAKRKVTSNLSVENVIHRTMMDTDDNVLSTSVVQTPEYSQYVESWQDGQQHNVEVLEVIGTQPDMPAID